MGHKMTHLGAKELTRKIDQARVPAAGCRTELRQRGWRHGEALDDAVSTVKTARPETHCRRRNPKINAAMAGSEFDGLRRKEGKLGPTPLGFRWRRSKRII